MTGSDTIDLAGDWALQDDKGNHRTKMEVPGDGITALQDAGLIPDPYWGRNEYDLRWICETDWKITRTIELSRTDLTLVASGLDTIANVSWNGQVILETSNAHRTYRTPIQTVACEGKNEIEITFRSPVSAGQEVHEKLPFPVPWHAENNPIPYGNAIRKVQCDFGWDWNIALAPFGITGSLCLERSDRQRVTGLVIHQNLVGNSITVTIAVQTNFDAPITFSLCEQSQTTDGTAVFTFNDPDLWWPNTLGPQTLHELTISWGDHKESRQIGLRDIRLDTSDGFAFVINGHRHFARGANWIPADALCGRITPEKTRALLSSAAKANMTLIRVWGGGRYEPDSFYQTCDELGLLVWQDFMFSCSLYPSTPEFLEEVDAEVREQVLRLQLHPCLALWCGDNELIGALTWFEESRKDRDRYLVSYDRLNRTIETALKESYPKANWWPSSPSPGPLDFGDAWHDDAKGDMHFWSVWHEGKDFDHYRDVKPRFCSEFGFQSYPSMPVIESFAEPQDFNIASPVLESHQKNSGGNARIAETMFRYFRFPNTFEDFVYLSQVQQGIAIKTAVEFWRASKPRTMGALYWQLNDTWPVASWSSLNYGGSWKLLHHMAQNFFSPLTIVALPDADEIQLIGINDFREDVCGTLIADAVDMAGNACSLADLRFDVDPAHPKLLATIPALKSDEILSFRWEMDDGTFGENDYSPRPYKALPLQSPNVTVTRRKLNDIWELTLQSDALGLFVCAEADMPGAFSRAAFTLRPDTPQTLTFAPDELSRDPTFSTRDLHSATYPKDHAQ